MTTTESRPSYAPVEPPLASSPAPHDTTTPHRRGGLGVRLACALAVLALAAGYAVGHDTNNPSPRVGTQAAVVTPQLINQALAATNGHPVVNDRGFSQLENGAQHSHGFDLPLSPADRKELAREMNLARETALRYPTLADAERAGMFRAGPFSPGLGTHMIMPSNYVGGPGAGRMTDAQIEHPMSWIYDGTKPDSPVAGLFYSASVLDPEGFVGPNDVWHQHRSICIVTRPGGGFDTPLGADNETTKAQCDAVGGAFLAATSALLHVWIVPGYEDVQGVYAHLNPAITCDDGTYHTVKKVGRRTSICVDGTE